MNEIDEYRVIVNPRPFRVFGCLGCFVMLFILVGIVGLLLLGWRSLLGI